MTPLAGRFVQDSELDEPVNQLIRGNIGSPGNGSYLCNRDYGVYVKCLENAVTRTRAAAQLLRY